MADAMGILGVRVERPQQLEEGIQRALQHDGPALVDIVSARQELVMPPVTTFDEAKHFGIFTLKAVMDGRFLQLVDLAKTNLTRKRPVSHITCSTAVYRRSLQYACPGRVRNNSPLLVIYAVALAS
jgi:hypothetical protein